MQTIEVSPANDQARLAWGVCHQPAIRSVNGGVSWTSLGQSRTAFGARSFAFDPVNTNVVYAAVDNYVAPARNRGLQERRRWLELRADPVERHPQCRASCGGWCMTPSRTNIVYLSAYFGVYKTTDGGPTWTHLPLFND